MTPQERSFFLKQFNALAEPIQQACRLLVAVPSNLKMLLTFNCFPPNIVNAENMPEIIQIINNPSIVEMGTTSSMNEPGSEPGRETGGHRLNNITCLEAAIQTLIRHNEPMNAKEIVHAMINDNVYRFSERAKTPWNTVGTQLLSYVKECNKYSQKCRIKCIKPGTYAPADYDAD